MKRKLGICANHCKCTLADRHYVIDSTEDNFFCTECSMPLRPSISLPEMERRGGLLSKIPQWVLLVLPLLLLAGVGGFSVWKLFDYPIAPQTTSTFVAPAPPPTAVAMVQPTSQLSVPNKSKQSSPNIILRLHGSNTIGAKLAPALVENFMKEKGYTEIKTVPLADLEILIKGKKPNAIESDAIEIKAHGSSTAFDETDKNKKVGLLGGYCDIGMSSSPVKKEMVEKFQAKNLGDLSSRSQEHVIALDGLAVIVNPNNTIDRLSVDKIRKIFLGEITDWSAVGGLAGKINIYSRDHQSGTYDTFKSLVLSGKELDCDKGENLKCFEDSKVLSSNVASDLNGIGFIGLNYIGISKPVKVSMADNVNALAPTRFTIKTEDYPLGRRLFLYQVNQLKPLAVEFIQFALSNEGQNVVSAVGSVGLNLDEKDKAVAARSAIDGDTDKKRLLADPAIPKAYKELIQNADRTDTPLNFRFQSGSFELDNRAFRDVGRLSTKLTGPEFAGSKLILVGFADPKGDAMNNLWLSKQRASKVKEQLEAEGLKVEIATGFGKEPSLLLDPREDEPASLAKNRRVEVWLCRVRPEVSQR
ncbi:MAG: phosphate ABC transporter substrate-binding/OmpA family protein [Deltaproteobacteria bacterium]|nr:phosphate ABC transporter substrate-binding/OmpA family protein [Deltaproteobacteria bacterium]